ncbi:hypothetical protein [Escherichia coli]|nr:hypothetical protein [Escherichia coli]
MRLRTENLTVSYGAQPCWMDFLSPACRKNHGLLGPNGCGNRRC